MLFLRQNTGSVSWQTDNSSKCSGTLLGYSRNFRYSVVPLKNCECNGRKI